MKPKILVVDDEADVRQFLSEFLEARGYEVITATDGLEGVTAFREHRPELVLLDVMMPQMNGLDALRQIRKLDERVGVVMLTGADDEVIANEAMRRTAYDFITKPIDLRYLELAIFTKLAAQ